MYDAGGSRPSRYLASWCNAHMQSSTRCSLRSVPLLSHTFDSKIAAILAGKSDVYRCAALLPQLQAAGCVRSADASHRNHLFIKGIYTSPVPACTMQSAKEQPACNLFTLNTLKEIIETTSSSQRNTHETSTTSISKGITALLSPASTCLHVILVSSLVM